MESVNLDRPSARQFFIFDNEEEEHQANNQQPNIDFKFISNVSRPVETKILLVDD